MPAPAPAPSRPHVVIRSRDPPSMASPKEDVSHAAPSGVARNGGPEPKVRDLMSTELLVCQSSDSCEEVAERMRQGNVGMLPVMDGGRPVGVVTDRDLVTRHLAPGLGRVPHRSVALCMTPRLIAVGPEASVSEATRLMRESGVRRLLVLQQGVLQGIVTLDDITLEVGRLASAALVIQRALSDYHEGRMTSRKAARGDRGVPQVTVKA